MSNTQLQKQIADEPQDVQNAVLAINTEARNRSLQVALWFPPSPPSSGWLTHCACAASPTSPRKHILKALTLVDRGCPRCRTVAPIRRTGACLPGYFLG